MFLVVLCVLRGSLAPVQDDRGGLAGVLMMRVAGSSVTNVLDKAREDTRLTPFLVDADGVLVHHPDAALRYSSLVPLPAKTLAEIQADQRFDQRRLALRREAHIRLHHT